MGESRIGGRPCFPRTLGVPDILLALVAVVVRKPRSKETDERVVENAAQLGMGHDAVGVAAVVGKVKLGVGGVADEAEDMAELVDERHRVDPVGGDPEVRAPTHGILEDRQPGHVHDPAAALDAPALALAEGCFTGGRAGRVEDVHDLRPGRLVRHVADVMLGELVAPLPEFLFRLHRLFPSLSRDLVVTQDPDLLPRRAILPGDPLQGGEGLRRRLAPLHPVHLDQQLSVDEICQDERIERDLPLQSRQRFPADARIAKDGPAGGRSDVQKKQPEEQDGDSTPAPAGASGGPGGFILHFSGILGSSISGCQMAIFPCCLAGQFRLCSLRRSLL